MVDFKINRGYKDNLPAAYTDGYIYFCVDTGEIFIDYLDENDNVQRKQINADEANRLVDYDIVNAIDDVGTTVEIPTTEAVAKKFSDRIVASDVTGELTNVLPEMFGGRTADEYALKSDLENVGGGVSSWNDLTDKPFGETTTVKEVLTETKLEVSDRYAEVSAENGGFSVGDKVTVVWEGASYTAIAEELSGAAAIGNKSFMGAGDDTGEPFLVGYMNGAFMFFTDASTATVSISVESTTIKKISGKYVEGMGYIEPGEPLFTLDLDKTVSIFNQKDVIAAQGYAFQQTNMQSFALTKNIGTVDLNSLVGAKLTKHNAGGNNAETEVVEVVDSNISGDTLAYGDQMTLTASGDLTINIMTDSAYRPGGYVSSLVGETIHPIDQKFLPSGGGTHMVEVVAVGPGTCTTDADWNEAVNAVRSGKVLCCDFHTIDADDHMYSTMACIDTAEGLDSSVNDRTPGIVFMFVLPVGQQMILWNPDGTIQVMSN